MIGHKYDEGTGTATHHERAVPGQRRVKERVTSVVSRQPVPVPVGLVT